MNTIAYNSRKAWLAFAGGGVIYFVNSACQYKVPPIMIQLSDSLHLSISQAGWLMSIMSLLGLILAIPAGLIVMKLGCRRATILTAVINLIGSVVGTFATSFGVMMAGRALEGVALGLVSVVPLAIIATFFPPEKRGIPNGAMMVLFTLSIFFMMNVAVPITDAFNWQGVWWLGNILSVVGILAAYFFIPRKEDEPVLQDSQGSQSMGKINYMELLKSGSLWCVVITFIGFNIGYFGISTYMPTYLVEGLHVDQATANLAVSWNSLIGIPALLLAGLLLDKVGISKRKLIPAIGMIVLAACYFFAFKVTGIWTATFLLIFIGFVCSFVPPALYTIGPDIIPKASYGAMIVAIVTLGQNMGMTLGPLVVGYLVEAAGGNWQASSVPITVFALIGAVFCFLVKVKKTNSEVK